MSGCRFSEIASRNGSMSVHELENLCSKCRGQQSARMSPQLMISTAKAFLACETLSFILSRYTNICDFHLVFVIIITAS